jgi:hypothetical protein
MPQKRNAKKQSANKRRGAQDAGRAGTPRSTPDMEPTPRPGTETEAETEVATADGEVRAGAMVKLCGLVKRSDLNGRLGFVEDTATLSQDGRWAVRLGAEDSFAEGEAPPNAPNAPNVPFAKLAVVCVRPVNLCILDQILAHDDQGAPMALQIRAGWLDSGDWNKSAAAVFYQLVRGLRLDGDFVNFQGTVSARCDGVWHRFRPPPVVAASLPPDQETFWNGPKLMTAIRARLASLCPAPSVEEAAFDWAAATEAAFDSSVTRVIARAHIDASVVHVALRTPENSGRFTLLQALSGADPASMNVALRIPGSMVLAPTECIVFHKDNMVKLPTATMSIDQAARKAAQVVREGVDVECPICLYGLASDERPAVFMPCSCKGGIHAECLLRLRDGGCVTCPLCRGRIEPGAWGCALR